jgi:ribokinase
MQAAIAVLGSLNLDFSVRTGALPAPGETVLGEDFLVTPGGKGANQAYAAARLGAAVRMLGRVGADAFGQQLRDHLQAAGVDVTGIAAAPAATGVALIAVGRSGQNQIVVAPGANHAWTAADVPALDPAAWLLLQGEVPAAVNQAAIQAARRAGIRVMLDPAPAPSFARFPLKGVDVLTPNESEACLLLGESPRELRAQERESVARRLLELGPQRVVLKLGAAGCYFLDRAGSGDVPGLAVNAVDSTAAGDTFNAALAVALAEGQAWPEALRFANRAAALSVTRPGAQASMPTRPEVLQFNATTA